MLRVPRSDRSDLERQGRRNDDLRLSRQCAARDWPANNHQNYDSEHRLSPSRQRYEVLEAYRWRYIDLGVANGFEAGLKVDQDGFVIDYEGLFEALD